jgi:RNA ligase
MNIQDIQNLTKQGFTDWSTLGHVSVKERGSLRLFNYTANAQYAAEWTDLELLSRGLIIDSDTGEVVARPFDKFFNWGEGGRFVDCPIKSITEKMDGSLGILYRESGEYRIATRGAFDSAQALWATHYLQDYIIPNYSLTGLYSNLTLLFEIIYPENRIVLDYGDREDLVLLAVRNRLTGEYLSWSRVQGIAKKYGFSMPQTHFFTTPEQLIRASELLPASVEGWVVEFMDGQRFKFKGDKYRALHKMISEISFKHTLEAEAKGTANEILNVIPDEFLDDVRGWLSDIRTTVVETRHDIECVFALAPTSTRKDYAQWVLKNHKDLAPYLFARLDGKPVELLIYKMAFKDRQID